MLSAQGLRHCLFKAEDAVCSRLKKSAQALRRHLLKPEDVVCSMLKTSAKG
jgi:hypothetical protein